MHATSDGGRAGFGTPEITSKIEATSACPIQPLTSHGIRTVAGLQVAYLNTSDKGEAQQLIEEVNSVDGDIDLLITSEWPANVTELATAPTGGMHLSACTMLRQGCPKAAQGCISSLMLCACTPFGVFVPPTMDAGTAPDGSSVVATLAQAARPRYHISTTPEVFYQRPPYMNPDRGVGSHATRFISLGTVGNSAKAKWIHALALMPASTMSAADICAVPEQSTQSPYLARGGQKRKVWPQFVVHPMWAACTLHPGHQPPVGHLTHINRVTQSRQSALYGRCLISCVQS